MKNLFLLFLLTLSSTAIAEWVEYSTMANGDVLFYDDSRVKKNDNLVYVWNRVRYKTSVMGASSYQSLVNIDCADRSETTLQSTFYTDKNWTNPAMATDTNAKPKVYFTEDSAMQRLATILCQQ